MNPGGGLLNRIIGWCFGLLLATIALYCAVAVLESILPALITIVGTVTILGLIIGTIVVIRTWRGRW